MDFIQQLTAYSVMFGVAVVGLVYLSVVAAIISQTVWPNKYAAAFLKGARRSFMADPERLAESSTTFVCGWYFGRLAMVAVNTAICLWAVSGVWLFLALATVIAGLGVVGTQTIHFYRLKKAQ